jgi:hypothetical protein
MFGLSRLAVWWLRLGIRLQRIKPGKPQQNGRHERMHLTLKNETTKPAAFNFLQQQERFEEFIRVYNQERPHQALGGAVSGRDLYTFSAALRAAEDPEYPFHDRTVRVTRCGRICLGSRKINLSTSLAEQLVGIREVDDQVWQVSFLEYDLGYFDRDEDRVEPGPNPFAPDTVLTMCPEARLLADAAELEGDRLGAYLEAKGVTLAEFEQWRVALEGDPASVATAKRIRRLERELARKDKALAEAAALLILKKTIDSLYQDRDEDDDTPAASDR